MDMRNNLIHRTDVTDGDRAKTPLGTQSKQKQATMSSAANKCGGFTLTELLVVIAIIVILLGLLPPAR
jgi:prepilin-type N-terminal cleavage/methylation domain-containing protein